MSILVGVFSRGKGPVPEPWIEALRSLVSRHPGDQVEQFQDARCWLAKVDVGAFGTCGFHAGTKSVAMLAGEPGLDGASRTRTDDLLALHESWERGDWSILRAARGVYSAAHFDSRTGRLRIMTDKLGERPLYFWADQEHMVFASALRILEGFPAAPKRMSVRGLSETAAFGFPLGDRTGYADIFRLRAGEMVEVSESGLSRSQYWRWDAIEPSPLPEEELLQRTYTAFDNAVVRLAGRDTGALAFLSGGLDSRCVVAALRSRNLNVHTLNFCFEGSQDQKFARAFAEAAGTVHREERQLPGRTLVSLASDALNSGRPLAPLVERPRVVWSGDGGSVGLGHVYLRPRTVEHLRAGRLAAAIDSFLHDMSAYIPPLLLSRQIRAETLDGPRSGVEEELADIHFQDPLKRFYAFLMLNDQRRHLSNFYEDMDLHRLEFLLPFFDSAFVETMMSAPAEFGLYHRFYNKWLALFPPFVTAVPWQSYAGHEPCPAPVPEGLSYQWSASRASQRKRLQKAQFMAAWRELLHGEDFPAPLLNKWYLWATGCVYGAGLRDYAYVFQIANAYHRHWLKRSQPAPAAAESR